MRGFTLIELLVVIAIIVGLSGILLPQFSAFNKTSDLQSAAAGLQTAFRNTQSNAVSGVGCSASVSASSWYLKFDTSGARSYRMETTCIGPTPGVGTPTPTPPVTTTFKFPAAVIVESIRLNSCSTVELKDSEPQVNFANISGGVSFISGSAGCPVISATSQMTVTLKSVSNSEQKSVIIEKGGSIYVKSN